MLLGFMVILGVQNQPKHLAREPAESVRASESYSCLSPDHCRRPVSLTGQQGGVPIKISFRNQSPIATTTVLIKYKSYSLNPFSPLFKSILDSKPRNIVHVFGASNPSLPES